MMNCYYKTDGCEVWKAVYLTQLDMAGHIDTDNFTVMMTLCKK